MKLYVKPGACSLSPHIVTREAGFNVDVVRADTKSADFQKINPKGYVPVLQLDDGQTLTEGVAIVQYLADHKPEAQLAPKNGTLERYRLQEWLNYIATEMHKGFSPLFRKPPAEFKQVLIDGLSQKLAFLDGHLQKNQFLMGERFTIADAYLFTILTWAPGQGLELSRWPALKAYFDRIGSRPAVKTALETEQKLRATA
ncbi:MAG: glutathione transferase GstA [Myxococcales bacterium]|nr:glutathione transferase GstA [Myxococcales bacterium]